MDQGGRDDHGDICFPHFENIAFKGIERKRNRPKHI
jgi:hypothetical protein